MKNKKVILNSFFAFVITSFFSCFSYAGSWISSGGDFLKDAGNPWYISSTKSMSYCIQVDEETISASPADIRDLVAKAFEYWKREFAPFHQYQFLLALGTQKIIVQDCNGLEDIRFQFGSGTLSTEQQNYFKNYKASFSQIIAQTTRTEYDRSILRGRGFVYVASDKGEASYETGGRLVENAWLSKGLIYRVLVHEIGHIYGLPHIGSGIMAESYVEEILDKRVYKEYAETLDLGSFFQGPGETANCKINAAGRRFFKLDSQFNCLFVTPSADGRYLNISAGISRTAKRETIGSIEYEKWLLGEGTSSIETQPGIRLWLPPEQKVFGKKFVNKNGHTISGPMFVVSSRAAKFQKNGSKSFQSVMVNTAPGKMEIVAQDSQGMRIIYSAVLGKRTYAE